MPGDSPNALTALEMLEAQFVPVPASMRAALDETRLHHRKVLDDAEAVFSQDLFDASRHRFWSLLGD